MMVPKYSGVTFYVFQTSLNLSDDYIKQSSDDQLELGDVVKGKYLFTVLQPAYLPIYSYNNVTTVSSEVVIV